MSTPEQAYGSGARTFTSGPSTAPSRPVSESAARGQTSTAARPISGPRKVRLTVARVDPWSAMKLSFLLSVAIGIALVVMTAVLWMILDGMGVFADVDRTIGEIMGSDAGTFNLMDYLGFGRVLSLATVIAVIDVFLLTALATLGAFLYNVCSSLVGGVHLTLTDD
ncbi:MAG TPA: DUF3566 domain-containing protein [Actinomycetales bacterium]|nr:DUF3566 domain-containing protein [Actinomycetales bacterium]